MRPLSRPFYIKDHSERLLCPLPLAIDAYRGCSTGCSYCSVHGLRTGLDCSDTVSPNSVKYIEKFFYRCKASMERQMIDQRCPVQLGVCSDPLQPIEKQQRATFRILKILQDREYPTVIVSKFPNRLIESEYLRALDGLPVVIQASISSSDENLLRRLEPGAPSLKDRMAALSKLSEAGAQVQIRLWPFAADLAGDNLSGLLAMAHDSGVKAILANPLKIYHAGGSGERLNAALGRDFLATTPLKYENHGVFQVASREDQVRELSKLHDLCRQFGMELLTCDDFLRNRNWAPCCGIDGLPGFEHYATWSYYTNGHWILKHTTFEDYMRGHDCPWHEEFEREWNAGKLARSIPELIFHKEDKTYSRMW